MAEKEATGENTEGGEEKKNSSAQLDLFAEKTEKVASKLEVLAERLAETAARPQPQPAAPPTPAQPPLTPSQVRALVEQGHVTQAQADEYLHNRVREEAKVEARREFEDLLVKARAQGANQVHQERIDQYVKAIPALASQGSAEWQRVAARYRTLVKRGHPETLLTQVTALEFVFGEDPGEHTEIRERTKERQTRHSETPSSSGGRTERTRAGSSKTEIDADLPPHVRNYVQRMININQYTGPDDPKAKAYVARYKKMRNIA